MARSDGEDVPVERVGFVQSAGLVQAQRVGEDLPRIDWS